MDKIVSGALAGFAATVPMTAAMVAMHRRLPARERYPLPPRQITVRAAGKAGVRDRLDESDRRSLSLLAHFGFGTTAGALFGPLAPRELSDAMLCGTGYGLA